MARSTYIYIILRENEIIGAFTVKYELENFLRTLKSYENIEIYRIRDNGNQLPLNITNEFNK